MTKLFKSAKDFRDSLGDRLLARSLKTGEDIQELMKKVAFDRFLARIFSTQKAKFLLKGGYALELNFEVSRTTKDIDLVLRESNKSSIEELGIESTIRESLESALTLDLGDHFSFILKGKEHSLDNTPYGGHRYGIECQVANKRYVSFHIDISVNDISREPFIQEIESEDWMSFAGVMSTKFQTLAVEEIFAEKIHAYTLPRDRPNSRVRDLVDMYIFVQDGNVDIEKLSICVESVFRRRNSHELPELFYIPPVHWKGRFEKMIKDLGFDVKIDEGFKCVEKFLVEAQIFKVINKEGVENSLIQGGVKI